MSADAQTAVFLDDKVIAQAMTSDLTKVEGKWVQPLSLYALWGKACRGVANRACG